MVRNLAVERAARAIWRALHPVNEVRAWDAFEREQYIRAAEMAAQVLQHDLIVKIPHLGRVNVNG